MHGLAEMRLGVLVLLLLERTHAEHEVRIAVVVIELEKTIGKPHRFVHLAVGQHRIEGHLQQFGVALIGPQRRPEIGGRRIGVALEIGLTPRKIIAGRSGARGVVGVRRLRRDRLGQHPQGCGGDREGSDRGYFHGSLISSEWNE